MFGSADVDPEEELELLKQILYANLPSKFLLMFYIYVIFFYHSIKQVLK